MITPAEFRDRGYLQEVNRRVLHPLGIAIALYENDMLDENGEFSISIIDVRNDPEGYLFLDLSDPESERKYLNVEKEFSEKAEARKKLGVCNDHLTSSKAQIQLIGTTLPKDPNET